jgi:RES domain-containing protein
VAPLDPTQLATVPRTSFSGVGYRQQAPGYDPRSGEGARRRGGRYNPPGSFPVLYLCRTRACAVAELRSQGAALPFGVAGLLPRVLFQHRIRLDEILDLTDPAIQAHLDIDQSALVQPQWSFTQHLGEIAHDLGHQGLLAPSATGVDDILVVFTEHIGSGVVGPEEVERWDALTDLSADPAD